MVSGVEHMILDAEHHLVPVDLLTWARFFEDGEARRVNETMVGDVRVSTVFIGIDHSFAGGPPLWFETMTFPDGDEGYTERYTTWAEAEAGHERVVAALREGREP